MVKLPRNLVKSNTNLVFEIQRRYIITEAMVSLIGENNIIVRQSNYEKRYARLIVNHSVRAKTAKREIFFFSSTPR